MRILIIIFCFAFSMANSEAKVVVKVEERLLEDALKDYENLKKEADSLLKNKAPDCNPSGMVADSNWCDLKTYCASPLIQKDSTTIYKNAAGEFIPNTYYNSIRDNIQSCLKEKFEDEINSKRDALTEKLKTEHLKKIIAANKKLNTLADKFGQHSNIQKISSAILTMSLENDLSEDKADEFGETPDKDDLEIILKKAEKKTKVTLNSEIKKTLIEIEYLKKNPLYIEEVKKIEASWVPKELSHRDIFTNWELVKSAEAAGGEKELLANRALFIKKSQEAYEIFIETQSDIINYLEGLKNEHNLDKIERIKARVEKIVFNPPRLNETVESNCTFPNAFYLPSEHSITVCPQFLNFPKMSIKETIAHEIAHSFDPCNLSNQFYQNKGPKVLGIAPFEIEIKMKKTKFNYYIAANEDPKIAKAEDRLQDKMKYSDNPFSEAISCLQSPSSVGAKVANIDEMKKSAQTSLNELEKLGQNNPNSLKSRNLNYFLKNAPDYFLYFEGCNESDNSANLGKSQINESFADKVASEIVARDLAKLSAPEAQKKILEIILTYDDICTNETSVETKFRDFAIKEGCPRFLESSSIHDNVLRVLKYDIDPKFDAHSLTYKRLEKITLAHPITRKILNCKEDAGVKYCE